MSKIINGATEIAGPVCQNLGVELWDVEFVNEGGRRVLRLYIEAAGGVGISQCESVSRAVEPLLDDADLYEDTYVLEVSSPGMERTLKKPEHFERYVGEQVDVRLFSPKDGKKSYSGTLLAHTPTTVTINTGGENVIFTLGEVSKVKLKPDYSKYF